MWNSIDTHGRAVEVGKKPPNKVMTLKKWLIPLCMTRPNGKIWHTWWVEIIYKCGGYNLSQPPLPSHKCVLFCIIPWQFAKLNGTSNAFCQLVTLLWFVQFILCNTWMGNSLLRNKKITYNTSKQMKQVDGIRTTQLNFKQL